MKTFDWPVEEKLVISKDFTQLIQIGDNRLRLSTNMISNLRAMGIECLFPVQSAILEIILRSAPQDSKFMRTRNPWDFVHNNIGEEYHDILAYAPTGSGKTLAYVLPIVEALSRRKNILLRALIVLPTIDLVKQVKSVFEKIAVGTDLKICAAYGGGQSLDLKNTGGSFAKEQKVLVTELCSGLSDDDNLNLISSQFDTENIYKSGCDVLICTPGRLIDHLAFTKGFSCKSIEWLVIDEADRLFSQSYNNWLSKVYDDIYSMPTVTSAYSVRQWNQYKPMYWKDAWVIDENLFDAKRDYPSFERFGQLGPTCCIRKMLFSATLSTDIENFEKLKLCKPILVMPDVGSNPEQLEKFSFNIPETLSHRYITFGDDNKKPLYLYYLITQITKKAICFTNTMENCINLHTLLESLKSKVPGSKIEVAYFCSTMSAKQRTEVLKKFEKDQVNLLISTDALSRGLDFSTENVSVISYDPPVSVECYVHRAGRTARAGKKGVIYSLLAKQECKHFKRLLRENNLWNNNVKRVNIDYNENLSTLEQVYEQAIDDVTKGNKRIKK